MSVSSIDEKRAQREADAKERALNAPRKKLTALDNETKYSNVDLMKHIDDNHIIKRIAVSMEQTKYIAYPASTAFLVMLSVFSGYAGRSYKVSRGKHDTTGIPLGLYIASEQPSGSGKDMAVNMFNDCFGKAFYLFKKEAKRKAKEAAMERDKLDAKDDGAKEAAMKVKSANALVDAINKYSLDLTDSTIEGVEVAICDSGGHATLASSEQELVNVLMGNVYQAKGGKSNKGLILKGFDGGRVCVKRAGNGGAGRFDGIPCLAIALFAQKGTFKTLYDSSEQSGTQERFLKIVEPNRGGYRDFVNGKEFNWFLVDDLMEILDPLIANIFNDESILEPKNFYDLSMLSLSDESINTLNHFRNEMESLVREGGLYHHCKTDMLGTLTKCDIQTLKIAACLHILDNHGYENMISNNHVISAINIVRDLLMSYHNLMENESVNGEKAQFEKIIEYISKQTKGKTITEVKQALRNVKPFSMEKSYQHIQSAIERMIEMELLKIVVDVRTNTEVLAIN